MIVGEAADSCKLAGLVSDIAQNDGDYTTSISELKLYRRSVATDPMPCIYGLGLGLTLQGGKRVTLGDEVYDYGVEQSLITAIDLPVVSYVTHASPAKPYLGVWLELDINMVTQLAARMEFAAPLNTSTARAMSVVTLDEGLRNALVRLIQLLAEPHLLSVLAPLIQQEIIIRLLNGEHGENLRRLVTVGTPSQQIAKVVMWLKQHFINEVAINDLASKAHMSPSTFRQHFRAVTGMSPLQYLKNLRLQSARQLMLNENLDAGSAALRVGYESASQFSREYSRRFGEPPHRDIKRIRYLS